MTTEPATTLASAPAKPKSSGFVRRALWTVGLSLVIGPMVLAWGSYWAFKSWARRSLAAADAEVERIRAAGEPVTGEEFLAWREARRPQPDATEAWLEALRDFGEPYEEARAEFFEDDEDPAPVAGEPWPQEEALRGFLKRYEGPLARVRALAATGGGMLFQLESIDIGTDVSYLSSVRHAAIALRYSACVHLQDGETDLAIADLRAMAHLRQLPVCEPFGLAPLIGVACHAILCDGVECVVERSSLTEEQLAELAEIVPFDARRSYYNGLIGERVACLTEYTRRGRDDFFGATRGDDQRFYLNYMRDYIDATQHPFPEALREARELILRVENLVQGSSLKKRVIGYRYMLCYLLLPASEGAIQALARCEWDRDATLTMLAIERFRLREGKLPVRLDELVPEFLPAALMDPFDGQAIRYRIEDGEAVLWSVGANAIDDGGMQPDKDIKPDLVLRISKKGEVAVNEGTQP